MIDKLVNWLSTKLTFKQLLIISWILVFSTGIMFHVTVLNVLKHFN